MEVDNQHPIDLSPKCRYYDESRPSCLKSAISSPRPLPDLIPIRILQDVPPASAHNARPFGAFATSSPFSGGGSSFSSKRDRQLQECFSSCSQSMQGLRVKERSRGGFGGDPRKQESPRYRGSPLTSPSTSPFSSSSSSSTSSPFSGGGSSYGSKMRKSQSDTRIAMPACLGHTEYSFGGRAASGGHHVLPVDRNSVITRSDGMGKFAAQRDRSYHDSSFFSDSKRDRRSDEDEISSSAFHSNCNKYVKQGPGVSLSTIQSLRKLLDKRKSMQKDG